LRHHHQPSRPGETIVSDNEKPNLETHRPTLALNSESATDPMQAAEARMRRALGLEGEQLRHRPAQERVEPPPRPMERFVPGGHKRRFVHDGEVPVTVVHGLISGRREHPDGNGSRNGNHAAPTNRLEVAEAALAAEIATRERTERALQEAQAAVHDLRTKLGHADLARQEAVEALRREREATEARQAELQEAQGQIVAAREAREAAERALEELREDFARPVEPLPAPAAPARRGRKPRAETAPVAEPSAPVAKARKVGRPRTKAAAPAREPKPIRWWLTPRKKRK
jgi:hypothetical protein